MPGEWLLVYPPQVKEPRVVSTEAGRGYRSKCDYTLFSFVETTNASLGVIQAVSHPAITASTAH